MFAQLNDNGSKRRLSLQLSVMFHCLLLAWILHAPAPRILAPSFIAAGNHGTAITYLYWPSGASEKETIAASNKAAASSQKPLTALLTWSKLRETSGKKTTVSLSKSETDTAAGPSSTANHAQPAGSPYGTVLEGLFTGDEVRPALPVVSSDPVVGAAERASITEGDVVIEVTIDEKGNIIQKVVLHSMGPAIDAKVLAALENWHFLPATRNGVAIPSKQDVHYHFRPS